MNDSAPHEKLHSAEFFGDQRDDWWNDDYVALLASRFGFEDVRAVLEIGAGVGHFSRVLLRALPAEARLIGIDREPAWVKEAAARAERAGLGARARYRLGDANKIPFHDGVFDLVACQTLLIHVADPRAVMREMMRVVKPGGLVLMVEPNNMAGALVLGSSMFDAPLDDLFDQLRLYLTATRGKAALGEGNDSIGELIPGYAAEIGLTDVKVYLNDRSSPLFPPYEGRAQQVLKKQVLDWADRDYWCWGRDETRRYFLAGGGGEADFDRLYEAALAAAHKTAAALREGREHQAGGTLGYVIGGRRPL